MVRLAALSATSAGADSPGLVACAASVSEVFLLLDLEVLRAILLFISLMLSLESKALLTVPLGAAGGAAVVRLPISQVISSGMKRRDPVWRVGSVGSELAVA